MDVYLFLLTVLFRLFCTLLVVGGVTGLLWHLLALGLVHRVAGLVGDVVALLVNDVLAVLLRHLGALFAVGGGALFVVGAVVLVDGLAVVLGDSFAVVLVDGVTALAVLGLLRILECISVERKYVVCKSVQDVN